jgi:hypothetical protein
MFHIFGFEKSFSTIKKKNTRIAVFEKSGF